MKPEGPLNPREALEIKITALLMGQLSPEEAAEVEKQIAADPELAALHARLRHAAQLLRESRNLPEGAAPAVPLQLSKERREQLLAKFRGIQPLPAPEVPPAPAGPVVPFVPPAAKRSFRKRVTDSPFILAASITVLLGGSIALFVSQTAFVKRMVSRYSAEQEETLSRSAYDPRGSAEYRMAVPEAATESYADVSPAGATAAPLASPAPAERPMLAGLSPEAQARASGWASQPGDDSP